MQTGLYQNRHVCNPTSKADWSVSKQTCLQPQRLNADSSVWKRTCLQPQFPSQTCLQYIHTTSRPRHVLTPGQHDSTFVYCSYVSIPYAIVRLLYLSWKIVMRNSKVIGTLTTVSNRAAFRMLYSLVLWAIHQLDRSNISLFDAFCFERLSKACSW